MPKLPRVTAKVFASNAPSDKIGQFGSALSGTKVTTSDIAEIQALPSYETGWTGAVISNRNYPTLEERNGLDKSFSQQIAYLLQSGMPEWDSSTEYFINQFCRLDSTFYFSLTDNNIGNNPVDDITNWQKVDFGGGGSGSTSNGHYLGQLICSPYPILDKNGETPAEIHRTDGGVVSSSQYDGFTSYLKKLASLYPAVSKTEAEWQDEKTKYGEVNAFVIDDESGTIRLPLIVNPIKGVTDLSQLGSIIEAGLPNIEGYFRGFVAYNNEVYSGPFRYSHQTGSNAAATAGASGLTDGQVNFDASLSNPVYGKSDTVQPQQPTGCYYIVLATGTTEDYTALEEYAPIEVHTLLESKYSESLLYNPAWLRSNGQWNAKSVYPAAYDILLIEHNSAIEAGTTTENGYTKRGLPVKLSTEEYTDYNFVINTADETFRLPLKNGREGALIKTAPVVSDGLMTFRSTSTSSLVRNLNTNNGNYVGEIIEGSNGTGPYAYESGLVADLEAASIPENSYLYYYVGNVAKNASVINAGRMQEQLVDKLGRTDKAEITSWALPDYKKGESKSWNTAYKADTDGWLFCDAVTQTSSVPYIQFSFDGETWFQVWRGDQRDSQSSACCTIPITKGMFYKGSLGTLTTFAFYPVKGAD